MVVTTNDNKRAGFTLIELLFTVTLFAVLAAIALGVIVTLSRHQSKTAVTQETNNNASSIMQELTTTIRSSKAVLTSVDSEPCTASCIALRQNDESIILYQLVGDALYQKLNVLNDPNPTRLTSPTVKITRLTFTISQVASPPPPPSVNINLEVQSNVIDRNLPNYSAKVTLQDSVVLRVY